MAKLKKEKWQYGHKRHKNSSEDEKQRLVVYRKTYYKVRKKTLLELWETIILKYNDLESSFDKEYKDVLTL